MESSVPKAVVLRLTPAPVIDSRSLSEPLLLDKPVVELVNELPLEADDDELESPRRWPRVLAALVLVGALAAGAVQGQKYLPHAWTPGFIPGPPFEPAKVALVLDDSKLKVELPVITLSAPEPKPKKPAKKALSSTGHW